MHLFTRFGGEHSDHHVDHHVDHRLYVEQELPLLMTDLPIREQYVRRPRRCEHALFEVPATPAKASASQVPTGVAP